MKKYVFILILSIMFATTGQAQKLIARQSGSITNFHATLDEAITQANNDDILYIPGGYFDITVPITKIVHIIGEGHNPHYSVVNGTTIIGGTGLMLSMEANGSTFQGVYVNCAIGLQPQSKNISFSRCSIHNIGRDADNGAFREYISLTECIIRNDMDCHIQYGEFNNCIFQGNLIRHFRNCNFRNCIFLSPNNPFSYIDFSRFEKCIFLSPSIGNSVLCYLYDNIFIGTEDDVVLDGTNLIGFNNKYHPFDKIFKKHSGNEFKYENDYHLKTDANVPIIDAGIYSGPSEWKENCFPMNPHVLGKKIAGYTDANGNLKVEIAVQAQQR